MSFSYTLFLVLLLLSPGLAVWAGFRIGERNELLSQAPERPQSTFSLIVIVFGALFGHLSMAVLFVCQAGICALAKHCLALTFDPNVYRAILSGKAPSDVSDLAIAFWLFALLLPSAFMFVVSLRGSNIEVIRNFREASSFGWLKAVVDRRGPKGFILAYVVTSMEKDGAFAAFEGIVENFALDDNKAFAMIVLSQCERFLVKIQDGQYYRDSGPTGRNKIALIQIDARNIKNVAIEVFDTGKLSRAITDMRAPEATTASMETWPLKASRPRRRAAQAKSEPGSNLGEV